jgi:hypothetical protein
VDKIVNHRSSGYEYADEYPWDIEVGENRIRGYTFMDNFDMGEFLEDIGVDMEFVKWGD